jgi:acetylornithine deacetylase/succinyl-diaminopimelate desuccinylase-like protein
VGAWGLALGAAHLLSGHLLRERSHGIVDDALGCGILIERAAALAASPHRHLRVRVVVTAGEEAGAQGARALARDPGRKAPDAVLNLEAAGCGPEVGFAALEWTGKRLAAPHADLVAALRSAAGSQNLHRLAAPVVTDAGPWLGRGVPAVTLLNLEAGGRPPRGLHGRADRMARIDSSGARRLAGLVARYEGMLDDSLAGGAGSGGSGATSNGTPSAASAVATAAAASLAIVVQNSRRAVPAKSPKPLVSELHARSRPTSPASRARQAAR